MSRRRQLSKAEQRAKEAADRRVNRALRQLLTDDEGRRVLRWILQESGALHPSCEVSDDGSFTSGSETFYREGRRSIGIGLIRRLRHIQPLAFAALAHEEAQEEIEARHAARSPESDSEETNDG